MLIKVEFNLSLLPYSSFSAALRSSPFGLSWDYDSGFSERVGDQVTGQKLVLMAQLFSEFSLHHLLQALSQTMHIHAVRENSHVHLTSCYALDIDYTTDVQSEQLKSELDSIADRYQVDLVAATHQPKLSEPGLLVMDMDSTMIQIECIDEIARLAGRYEEVANVTAQAMNGQLAFSDSLKTRVACLRGVEESALARIKAKLPLMPGLWQLVSALKQHHWRVAIASGGFTYFADYLKDWLELDAAVSNTLGIKNNLLTGTTEGDIVDASVKATTLNTLREQWDIDPSQTVAMGDGANDLKMLEQASLGVAFHAKPSVRKQAQSAILHQPLDALLLLLAP